MIIAANGFYFFLPPGQARSTRPAGQAVFTKRRYLLKDEIPDRSPG
jgi:hypothetical protein